MDGKESPDAAHLAASLMKYTGKLTSKKQLRQGKDVLSELFDFFKKTIAVKIFTQIVSIIIIAVNKELEHFLELMENNGIKSEMFELEGNNTSKKYSYNEGEKPYLSERIISIRMPLSTYNINSMMQYIAKYKLNVVLNEEYIYSDLTALHKELLRDAIADSKSKAELIASFTGQKIKGIARVTTQYSECSMDFMCQEQMVKLQRLLRLMQNISPVL